MVQKHPCNMHQESVLELAPTPPLPYKLSYRQNGYSPFLSLSLYFLSCSNCSFQGSRFERIPTTAEKLAFPHLFLFVASISHFIMSNCSYSQKTLVIPEGKTSTAIKNTYLLTVESASMATTSILYFGSVFPVKAY